MREIIIELAKRAGAIAAPSMRGDMSYYFLEDDLIRFADHLISSKQREIELLQSQLFTSKAQNDLYQRTLQE